MDIHLKIFPKWFKLLKPAEEESMETNPGFPAISVIEHAWQDEKNVHGSSISAIGVANCEPTSTSEVIGEICLPFLSIPRSQSVRGGGHDRG